MLNPLFSDRRAVDSYGNLIHVTATAFADVAHIRSCVNIETVRDQSVLGRRVTQEELDRLSEAALETLKRSAAPITQSDLAVCPASGRVL